MPPRTDQIDWFAKFVVIGRPDNLKKELRLANFSNKKKRSPMMQPTEAPTQRFCVLFAMRKKDI